MIPASKFVKPDILDEDVDRNQDGVLANGSPV
jgi:hypothetical protein